ncbi:hypothetical protein [Chitinimonas taiwanensis]|uniref:Transcription factor zinc-finger n=1 Tax=Chitinimonas taiwanensis DSM 18899 TaxID=1121279 RepID=A0A1K2HL46_9NEIS|nr:hypothetical protein SAMN02745887_02170 [Chitinimonas taiwanensis DSM 18899]
MLAQRYASKQGGQVEVDFCFPCRLIWFDQYESNQLSPDAVVELFELLHAHRAELQPTQPLSARLACVHCQSDLLPTQDRVRSTTFQYFRCGGGHGRLISFWHFLREKQFVRDLTAPERQQLAAQVAQRRCESCGATVDVRDHSACSYCRAPLAVLDRDAVGKALEAYRRPSARTVALDQADALLAREKSAKYRSTAEPASFSADELMDRLFDGLGELFRLLR